VSGEEKEVRVHFALWTREGRKICDNRSREKRGGREE
jgi:hypothetical protein